ncbi:MAG: hypothetical protein ACK5LL_03210 [Suipraeoptans sp.]
MVLLTSDGHGEALTILMVYLGILLLLGVLALVSYILRGIGMYTLGKRKGMTSPWLAFIPYARTYYQGELCGSIKFKDKEIKSPGIWMLVAPIVRGFFSGIMVVVMYGALFGVMFGILAGAGINNASEHEIQQALESNLVNGGTVFVTVLYIIFILVELFLRAVQGVLTVIVNQQIYSDCTDKNLAIAHSVAGIFIPMYTSIYFFVIRNKQPHFTDTNINQGAYTGQNVNGVF